MGNWFHRVPPPPVVLVPPLFDFPPLAARTRMLESSYNVLFGKLALRCLFDDYFEEARRFSTKIMLKPIDDPHVDLVATVSAPLDDKLEESIVGDAIFRWQGDVDDPNTFAELFVSNSKPALQIRSSAYHPRYGLGAFAIFPLIPKGSVPDGVMGLRYGTTSLSFGVTALPFAHTNSKFNEMPQSAWLVSKMGRLTVGVQYEPEYGSNDAFNFKDLKHWSCAMGYGIGFGSPLAPSFNFSLELAKNSQFIASFYQHVVVQRRVKNPIEANEVVGITNYIDVGFELQTRVDDAKASNDMQDSTFQVAASWQANKNFLLKGKVGSKSSSVGLSFKSWWKPSFTFSLSATRERGGTTAFGVGLRVENLREASYQRADPNFIMLTPSKEHLAEGIAWEVGKRERLDSDAGNLPKDRRFLDKVMEAGKRPMLQSDVNAGNFEKLPKELRPLNKVL